MVEWLLCTWSQLNHVIITSNKYVDHKMMSISLVKVHAYGGVDSVVIF